MNSGICHSRSNQVQFYAAKWVRSFCRDAVGAVGAVGATLTRFVGQVYGNIAAPLLAVALDTVNISEEIAVVTRVLDPCPHPPAPCRGRVLPCRPVAGGAAVAVGPGRAASVGNLSLANNTVSRHSV